MAKNKPENVSAEGVAIYRNESDHNNIVTFQMDIHSRALESIVAAQFAIGEFVSVNAFHKLVENS
jgi:hypothetical protein